MSSSFTSVNAVDMSKEKDWPANLGMLDWDSTSIVFTKRSLIEFLKYTGTTVDPNFTNIGKLPRYAKFGKLSEGAMDASVNSADATVSVSTNSSSIMDDFKPTRRPTANVAPATVTATTSEVSATDESGIEFESGFKPSRRVRTNPGGPSSMANLWDPAEPEEFKPTRRVRQGPGGQDNITGIF
ncbi:hypothetical protein D9615_001784 [Tricholomella constricta]|uniref:Uncharacterized protein n=1 Tax=Tricholomella constricta TaxID=117010 RepID=A0A8H5MAF9_9AGAR|nr:hypothetical protein D9615_001784 [Tricholomella constricta]